MTLDATLTDRYDRQRLITWWDQDRLAAARVLVVGAGALGNELVKCLALVGVGQIHVVDGDVIERSNLARCPFFTTADENQPKAEVLARAASRLNADVTITYRSSKVQELGVGAFTGYDLVLGGLDNREARLWVNQACRKVGVPWIDGAIEGLRGTARVFLPDTGPCYECTLGEADRAAIAHRMSCALLTKSEMLDGKTPTTATSASIVAAVQAQEAIKILAGRPELVALAGRAWNYVGDTMDSWTVDYSMDEECMAHDSYVGIREAVITDDPTLRELLRREQVGDFLRIELEDDLVLSASCGTCEQSHPVNRRRSALRSGDGECRTCSAPFTLKVIRVLSPDHALLDARVSSLDLATCDILTVTTAHSEHRTHLLLRASW